ncbi:Na+/H+ antiporter NhaC [Kineosphaera limosa]|uniref:Na+/H+ antiporter NhaC-like C-terminal domain-containing protein n=1 Tax=Kineosphaera limosa NBRC 100340 TaxID=1184609 RepID=K6WPN2_9MICO|nr:Na+/H+ antiporter NhaC family protein [Kineosphaera limosa]NYE00050.1 Na+/H+ antiporter NhaC [Kineosphaera limosa]GAB95776.1 hypothetical protein KILIM_026_00470 [Kineosphaera limosa NBRC 100340]
MIDSQPWLTLLPPLLAIVLAILTRRVLLSLGAGVVACALLIADFSPGASVAVAWQAFAGIFVEDGELNTGQVYIVLFMLLLGAISAFVLMSGGTRAFADWAYERIHTRRGATFLPAILGLAIFIDDYFNALTVGQVSRPVTDRFRVSRAKLAYIVDSTSAPVSVIVPFSSWGAYIIGVLAPIVAASTLTISGLEAFVGSALANYYAFAAIFTVGVILALRIDFGPMRDREQRALEHGEVVDDGSDIPGKLSEDLPVHHPGAKRALVVPFLALVVAVLVGIVWTGYQGAESWELIAVLAETDVVTSLLFGGIVGLAVALYYYVRYTSQNPQFGWSAFGRAWHEGIRSMIPAIAILLFAWTLGTLIDELGTGTYLGHIVEASPLTPAWLVPLMFLVADTMAFATGSSWGSFGLLLPIAGAIMVSLDAPELLLAALGAVLAGAVMGDHMSPISDTTILSATGSTCGVITHVVTQLPYAAVSGLGALIGYVALALTGHTLIGLVVALAATTLVLLGIRAVRPPLSTEAAEKSPQPAR